MLVLYRTVKLYQSCPHLTGQTQVQRASLLNFCNAAVKDISVHCPVTHNLSCSSESIETSFSCIFAAAAFLLQLLVLQLLVLKLLVLQLECLPAAEMSQVQPKLTLFQLLPGL